MVSVRTGGGHRRAASGKRSPSKDDPIAGRYMGSCVRTLCLAGLLACLLASLQLLAATRNSGKSSDGASVPPPPHQHQVYFREDPAENREATLRQRSRTSPDVERGKVAAVAAAAGAEPVSAEGAAETEADAEDGDDQGDDESDDTENTGGKKEGAVDDKDEYQKHPDEAGKIKSEGDQVKATANGGKTLANPATSQQAKPVATVAYAVSVTGCGSDPITEGAAVLKHSIHSVSSRAGKSKYDYEMFAIYHPSAESCAKPLEELGYRLLKREVFVKVADIQGDYLREHIEDNGCCGERELIKLEAYMLTDYPLFVHLDLDVLVLKPMDDIFDMMLLENAPPSPAIMWPNKSLPQRVNAFYTYDYNMVWPSNPNKPVQGGFLVARPDRAVYDEFRDIVRKGDFREGHGWGGEVGPFHGSMTFQGIVPYYYDILHPGQSVELNRCIYNQMCDNPRDKKTVNDVVNGRCRTGEAECEDCRSRPLEDVVTTHFTLCQKPWTCLPHSVDRIQDRLCRKLTHEWYRVRSDLDKAWGRPGMGPSDWERDQFFGYCSHSGGAGYQPIEHPYGPSQAAER